MKDGFAGAIIDLGREMTGGWYNWSERKCPRAEPGCYALAWRHARQAEALGAPVAELIAALRRVAVEPQ